MCDKDQCFDPVPEYDSGSDNEWTVNRYTEQLNNEKTSSPPSPGFVAFIRNDVSEEHWRIGGPLSDPPPNNQRRQETRPCVNCNNPTAVWHAAERFECDGWYADDPDERQAHNQLCAECATDEAACSQCPVHANSFYKSDVDEDREPTVVWRAG